MEPGDHIFPFLLLLPEDLPSSFKNNYGKIQFSVSAIVYRPWKTNFEDKKDITIISPIKLNKFPAMFHQPVEYSDERGITPFCFSGGLLQLVVTLQKRAFVIGENINIKVYCKNMSNINVEQIRVQIEMRSRFKMSVSTTKYKEETLYLASATCSGVESHKNNTYNMLIPIPISIVLPNFSGSKLFSYETPLKISAILPWNFPNLEITTPVALGHVPYLQISPNIPQYVPPYPAAQLSNLCPTGLRQIPISPSQSIPHIEPPYPAEQPPRGFSNGPGRMPTSLPTNTLYTIPPYPVEQSTVTYAESTSTPMPMPIYMPMPMPTSMPIPSPSSTPMRCRTMYIPKPTSVPIPVRMSMPMPTPTSIFMPSPTSMHMPGTPAQEDSSRPSSLRESGISTGESRLNVDENCSYLASRTSRADETPPPTYDEAIYHFS